MIEHGYRFTLLPELAVENLTVAEKKHDRKLKRPARASEFSVIMHRSVAKRVVTNASRDHVLESFPIRLRRRNRG